MLERVTAFFAPIVKRNWVTLILMSLLLTSLVYSMELANWVQDETALTTAFLLGIFFGWLLARSRFRGWFAAPYAIIISLVISIQAAGKILPSLGELFSLPLDRVIDQTNLRVVSFYLRATGWIEILRSEENITDSGIFVLLLGVILAVSGIWLMWALMRRRNFLAGLLPVGLIYAVNVHLDRQPLTYYMVYLFCAALLIARTSFNRQHEDWERRRVDYPEQLGLEWGSAAVVIALVIALAARAAPLFGTSEGWRAISDWVNSFHTQTSTTATRLFSGVNQPPPEPDLETDIYANPPNLAQIGAPIPQGDKTIMWVTISDPPPPPTIVGVNIPSANVRTHYWRNAIYATYTGTGWELARLSGQPEKQVALPKDPPPGRYFLKQTFDMQARHVSVLFATSDPVQTTQGTYLRATTVDNSRLVEGQSSKYEVISSATRVSANQLAEASVDYPVEIRSIYLQLPPTLPGRVRTLAERIAGSAADPYHKALRIQNYLRENYQYDLSVTSTPEKHDVVDYFLFDAPGGFCSHYASAMAVMLRSLGVPARVATGYAMGDYEPDRAAYRVPESAAHAWVEVFFPGYGWIEFEPTVGRTAIEYTDDGSGGRATLPVPGLDTNPNELSIPQPYFLALVAIGALLLLSLPFWLLRMFTTTRQAPLIQVDVLYRRMRRTLGWAGLAAAVSVTPDEYLSLFSGKLEQYERISQALTQTTALYRESVYSPRAPDSRRVRSALLLWQRSFGEWLVLWLRVSWQKIRANFTAN